MSTEKITMRHQVTTDTKKPQPTQTQNDRSETQKRQKTATEIFKMSKQKIKKNSKRPQRGRKWPQFNPKSKWHCTLILRGAGKHEALQISWF